MVLVLLQWATLSSLFRTFLRLRICRSSSRTASCVGSALGHSPVFPELHVAILAEGSALHQLSLVPHEVLDGDVLVPEDAQVVADDVAVAARRAGDEHGALVVALLGHDVRRAVAARHAGEG